MGGHVVPVAVGADQSAPTGAESVWGPILVMAVAGNATGKVWSVAQQVKKLYLKEDNGAGDRRALVYTGKRPDKQSEYIFIPVVFSCPVQEEFADQ